MNKLSKSQRDRTKYSISYAMRYMTEVGEWWQSKRDDFSSLEEAKKEARRKADYPECIKNIILYNVHSSRNIKF